MAEPFIVVDSDILIDVSRGNKQAIKTLEEFEETNKLCISVVTQLELMVGCDNKKEFKELQTFLERFEVLQLTTTMSTKTVDLLRPIVLVRVLK